MAGPIRLGAIDAGSNAIRIVIAELTPTDLIRIEAERMPVRLGHTAFTRGELDPAMVDQAVAAFIHFRERFDFHKVTMYRAVATSAVRGASNRDLLLHRLYHEAGIELEVIEGEEEARLVRKATIAALGSGPATALPRAILDLGGGSLEVNLRSGTVWRGYSLPVGTVRLLETFGLDGAIADAEAGMVRRYTATLMQTINRSVSQTGVAAATGGNAEALTKIVGEPAADGLAGFELAALEKLLPQIVGATVEERMARYGVKRDRAEVLGIAALVFATAARQLGIARLVSPGVGVREAVLLELAETAREEQQRAEGAHDKALLTAARGFANRVDHDTTHGEHVRLLARTLFHQLRDVHGVPDDKGVLLEVAALLHDVGEVVNPRGHHKHSEYMIRWARLPGLAVEGEPRLPAQALGHPAHRRWPRHRASLARRAGRRDPDGRGDRARSRRAGWPVARRCQATSQVRPARRRARPRNQDHRRATDRRGLGGSERWHARGARPYAVTGRWLSLLGLAGCQWAFPLENVTPIEHDASVDANPAFCYHSTLASLCLPLAPTLPLVVVSGTTMDVMTDNTCEAYTTEDPSSTPESWCVLAATTIEIRGTLRATGMRPLVLVADGDLVVAGLVDVSSSNAGTGAGANPPACVVTQAMIRQGGHGGSFVGTGGTGGRSPIDQDPVAADSLRGGCRGAGGGIGSDGVAGGMGGIGGGAVQGLAHGAISIAGTINASGGGGKGASTTNSGGGGAGAGGLIGLAGTSITITATGAVFANGGGGGEGAGAPGNGVNGGDPIMAQIAAIGGEGGAMNGGPGGNGSVLATLEGQPGGIQGNGGGGGGGGGAGAIKLEPPATIVGKVSPTPN